MKKPIIPLLAALIAGIAVGALIHISCLAAIALLFPSLIFLFLSIIKQWKFSLLLFLLISLFSLGILNINLYLHQKPGTADISRYMGKNKIAVEGLICTSPRVLPHKTDLIVSTTRIIKNGYDTAVNGKILLSVKDNKQAFKYGDYIRAKTRLKKPHSFNNPGAFDYERYLLYKGIKVRGFINNSAMIVILRENRGNILKLRLEKFRTSIRNLISATSPNDEGKILQALILGEKGEIPEDILENFKRTGISHVLAISGLHIGIIAFLALIFIKTIMKSSEYLLLKFNIIKISALFATIPIMCYAFVAGLGISTIRATIMILTFIVAVLLGKERDLLNTLALAAFIILIVTPVSLFDVSFQLSFTAVASILIITPRLTDFIPRRDYDKTDKSSLLKRKFVFNILLFIIVSFAATIGTLPLIAFYFNRLSTITLLSNIVIVPIIGFCVLPLGLLTIIIAPFISAVGIVLIKIASFFTGISVSIINFLASFSLSYFFVTTPTLIEIAFYYFLIIVVVHVLDGLKLKKTDRTYIESPLKRAILKVTLTFIIIFFTANFVYLHVQATNANHVQVTFIDVGQGNSTLVEFPGGKRMLIDGGGFYGTKFDIGRYVVAPFLWHQRIKKIDIVVLTHPDQDHLGGLIYILEHFDVDEVWSNGEYSSRDLYKEFTKVIRKKNVFHRIVSRNTPDITIGNTVVKILHPAHPIVSKVAAPGKNDFNNNSVVLKITYGKISLLFPADITGTAERNLAMLGNDLRSNILMGPHHGSCTSSTIPFLKVTRPEIVVFSCGPENVFHFPHPEVLDRYRKIGARIFRTDKNGAVTIKTDGRRITVKCQIPEIVVRPSKTH